MKLRIGLIGLGPHWKTLYQPALRALGDRFEVRAVCHPVAHRAEQVAHEWKARTCDSFREVAFAEDIDVLLLLSAQWFGSLPILAACEAGKGLYCGASLELNAHEAASLRNTVRQAGIAFMAEFPRRLAPATLRLQELIATRLGKPRMLFCNHRLDAPPPSGANSTHPVNLRPTIEMVDWCRYLVGSEPTSVVGMAHPVQAGPEAKDSDATDYLDSDRLDSDRKDYLMVLLDFPSADHTNSGALAQIACGSYVDTSWREAAAFRRPADLQVVCEHGVAFIDLPASLVWFDSAGQHTESLESERPVGEQLLLHFHRQVASLVLKTASLEDAYRATTIVLAAQQSYEQGKRIPLT